MTLEVIGAGLGRTGTESLKLALEQLLTRPCHHMGELFQHPDQIDTWHEAADGQLPNWDQFLSGYAAVVDYPGSAFWSELATTYSDALVLLSVRSSPQQWWESANSTIFESARRQPAPPDSVPGRQHAMATALYNARFTAEWDDEKAAIAAYETHNQKVRDYIDPDRLLEWKPGDGWEPICEALNLPAPQNAFPHTNTTADFRATSRID